MKLPCRGPIPLMRVWYTHTPHMNHVCMCIHICILSAAAVLRTPSSSGTSVFTWSELELKEPSMPPWGGDYYKKFKKPHCKINKFSLTVAPTNFSVIRPTWFQ